MEVSRKVEKKWAAFVSNKTKQNIWSKQAMLHWTHCYITRVLHQRPLIHWANLTLALHSQSTQREQFICAFKCWVWSEPNQIFFAQWDLYTCCCWLYNTSEREQVPQRPLPTPVAHSYCNNQAAACWLAPTQQSQIVHFLEASLETDFKTKSAPIRVQMTNITAIKSISTACIKLVLV